MKKRTNHTPEFKTKVVLEILSEESTVNQIAPKYDVSPVVLSETMGERIDGIAEVRD